MGRSSPSTRASRSPWCGCCGGSRARRSTTRPAPSLRPPSAQQVRSVLADVPAVLIPVGLTPYAGLRGSVDPARARVLERVFGLSSILTPFALGAVAGGIASGRVPVGNAAGARWESWLNPTSVVLGVMLVAMSAYLAAVYLAADARR